MAYDVQARIGDYISKPTLGLRAPASDRSTRTIGTQLAEASAKWIASALEKVAQVPAETAGPASQYGDVMRLINAPCSAEKQEAQAGISIMEVIPEEMRSWFADAIPSALATVPEDLDARIDLLFGGMSEYGVNTEDYLRRKHEEVEDEYQS